MPFERKLANMALGAQIEKQHFAQSPLAADEPTFWTAANGIQMSEMPAFKTKLSDIQLRQVSQLVAHANEIPESMKKVLVPRSGNGNLRPRSGCEIMQDTETSWTKTFRDRRSILAPASRSSI